VCAPATTAAAAAAFRPPPPPPSQPTTHGGRWWPSGHPTAPTNSDDNTDATSGQRVAVPSVRTSGGRERTAVCTSDDADPSCAAVGSLRNEQQTTQRRRLRADGPRRSIASAKRAADDRFLSTDPETGVASELSEAAMCVQDIDVQCVLQFTLIHAAGCALHRHASRVIHRLELYHTFSHTHTRSDADDSILARVIGLTVRNTETDEKTIASGGRKRRAAAL